MYCSLEIPSVLGDVLLSTNCARHWWASTGCGAAEVNDLKAIKRKQAVSARQEASLEKIYSSGTSWPSNELVQEISQLAGMHRNAVKRWFEDRRKSRH